MKKFILSLLILPLLLIGGFSSAYTYSSINSISCNGGQCSPGTIDVPSNSLGVSVVGGSFSNCVSLNVIKSNGQSYKYLYPLSVKDFMFDYDISSTKLQFNCEVNQGDINFKFIYPDPPIVSGTFDNFTPVIDGISDVTTEFIPYVVYIGIGTLLVTLGFIAVKWLVNWLVRKITVIFKSKRG